MPAPNLPSGSAGNINAIKSSRPGWTSLLLCTITAFDGSYTLRLSTGRLNTTDGGVQYGGNSYLALLLEQNLDSISATNTLGIGTMSLQVNDADRSLWRTYEYNMTSPASAVGFKGATVTVRLVYWQPGTSNFSNDSQLIFSGYASKPWWDGDVLNLEFTNIKNASFIYLPLTPIQKTCDHDFPNTSAFRILAADDDTSRVWPCGYSPDSPSSNARGNMGPGGVPYTTCNRTPTDCMARGMWNKDSSNRDTRRYSGSWWSPPLSYSSVTFGGGKVIGYNSANETKFGQRWPWVLGTQWVTAAVENAVGDANSARFEICPSLGNVGSGLGVGGIYKVIINDHQLPYNNGSPSDPLYRYDEVTTGNRTGAFNTDAGYTDSAHNPLGDPHGGRKIINAVVPVQLTSSASIPNARVLLAGEAVRYYTDPITYTKVQFDPKRPYTNDGGLCPPWLIFRILTATNWDASELDIQSFIDAVPLHDELIPYTRIDGSMGTHCRFSIAIAFDGKSTRAMDVPLRNLLLACNSDLSQNPATGLYRFTTRGTLATQHPTLPPGSNYTGSGVPSLLLNGTAANGYPAWVFDDTNTIWEGNSQTGEGRSSIKQLKDQGSDASTSVAGQFQDAENQFQVDSLQIIDTDALPRTNNQRLQSSNFSPEGILTYDQFCRQARTIVSEQSRGNLRNDAGGTMRWRLKGTAEINHLRKNDIVLLNSVRDGLVNQPARVGVLNYSKDMETVETELTWHNDIWYVDSYTQSNARTSSFSDPSKSLTSTSRTCFVWKPGYSTIYDPQGFIMYGNLIGTFGLAIDTTTANNNNTPIPDIDILGLPPVNDLSPSVFPPQVPLFANVSAGGGTIKAGKYCLSLTALDNGSPQRQSNRSNLIFANVPSDNSSITIPNIYPQPGTMGYVVYFGYDEQTQVQQQYVASGSLSSGSVTVTSPPAGFTTSPYFGPPDPLYNKFRIQIKREYHGGRFTANTSGRLGTTPSTRNKLVFPGQTFTSGPSLVGVIVSFMAQATPGAGVPIPIWSGKILAGYTDTTVEFASIPTSVPISAGDTFLFRLKLDTLGDTTFGDSGNQSTVYPTGWAVNSLKGMEVRVLFGTGAGQPPGIVASNTATLASVTKPFPIPLDATSVIAFCEPGWAYNELSSTIVNNQTNDMAGAQTRVAVSAITQQFAGELLYVRVLTADADGNTGLESLAPFREVYIVSKPDVIVASNPYVELTPNANGEIIPDLALGLAFHFTINSGVYLTGISNSDFEAATLSPAWNVDSHLTADATTFQPRNGNKSLAITACSSPAGYSYVVWQTLSGLTPGTRYAVSVWFSMDETSTAGAFLTVDNGAGGNGSISSIYMSDGPGSAGQWKQIVLFYVADSTGNCRIQPGYVSPTGAGPNGVYYDDVTVSLGQIYVRKPIKTGGVIDNNTPPISIYGDMPVTAPDGGYLGPLFEGGNGGYAANFYQDVSGRRKTRTSWFSQYHGVMWGLDNVRTNDPV